MGLLFKECSVVLVDAEPSDVFIPGGELLKCIKSYRNEYDKDEIDEGSEGEFYIGVSKQMDPRYYRKQHMYITSSDEIKECDWYTNSVGGVFQAYCDSLVEGANISTTSKKVIASTDILNRYIDGDEGAVEIFHGIPKSFIEHFVKNPVYTILVHYTLDPNIKAAFKLNLNSNYGINPIEHQQKMLDFSTLKLIDNEIIINQD